MKDGGLDLLGLVDVASPCDQPWEQMPGDAQVRRCASCARQVYNFSELTSVEARELLLQREGRLCVRFYRRKDGTLLTRDCRSPFDALSRKIARAALGVATVALALAAYVAGW